MTTVSQLTVRGGLRVLLVVFGAQRSAEHTRKTMHFDQLVEHTSLISTEAAHGVCNDDPKTTRAIIIVLISRALGRWDRIVSDISSSLQLLFKRKCPEGAHQRLRRQQATFVHVVTPDRKLGRKPTRGRHVGRLR